MVLDVISQSGDLSREIVGITEDSRQVKPGDLFVAVKGTQVDGHNFIGTACEQGAVGILLESSFERTNLPVFVEKTSAIIEVRDTRAALGELAARFWKEPSQSLTMIGITGTNGNTTVTHLAKGLLEQSSRTVGLVGTIGCYVGSEHFPTSHTTPGSVALQSMLNKMVNAGADSAVLEV